MTNVDRLSQDIFRPVPRSAEIACLIDLSPRQVNYSLKGVRNWLAQEKIPLKVTPGLGVELECSPAQTRRLLKEMNAKTSLQLVLTAAQRQQLLALVLLTTNGPLIRQGQLRGREKIMSYEMKQEKSYDRSPTAVYSATTKAVASLQGEFLHQNPDSGELEAKFDKKILGDILGDSTQMTARVRSGEGEHSAIAVKIYPIDAVRRKLMFGARKGVTQSVMTWFFAHLEHNTYLYPH